MPTENGGGTIAKGLELLRALGDFPDGATAAQMAHVSGHPFSTVYRLLGTLVSTGFVEFETGRKMYRLGLPVFELGQRVAHERGFAGTALPVLTELSRRTKESSLLATLDGTSALTVHTVDGPQFRTTTNPGDRSPLHTTAIGKCLLAALSAAELEELLPLLDLEARTPNSVTDPEVLRAQLEEAARLGWAEQGEENDPGMNAIAVPITRLDGRTVAALALAAPIFRADLDQLRTHLPALRESAAQLALTLP